MSVGGARLGHVLEHVFGPEREWPAADLIGLSDDFTADLTVAAYCSGVFPMPLHETDFDEVMGWWSPQQRGVLPLDRLRISRSLRKSAARYRTTVDRAFPQVLAACADPRRPSGWIDDDIVRVFTELHDHQLVHSVETWDASGRLVGGLYGVAIGGLFAGESMFHDPVHGRDASKVALIRLVEVLLDGARPDQRLLDVQWRTPHLASLGVVEISRHSYLNRLGAVIEQQPADWEAAATAPPRGVRISPEPKE